PTPRKSLQVVIPREATHARCIRKLHNTRRICEIPSDINGKFTPVSDILYNMYHHTAIQSPLTSLSNNQDTTTIRSPLASLSSNQDSALSLVTSSLNHQISGPIRQKRIRVARKFTPFYASRPT
ncbi:3052_t:CDS:2, partial [Gigaspora rosea]